MKNKAYIIKYQVFCTGTDAMHGVCTIRVKNCMGELHAKIKLEDFLKRKHPNFARLVVLNCTEDLPDILNFFKGFTS